MAEFTKTFHTASYPAIDPTLPANSQAGRTVLVAGGSEGIGFATARSYVRAGAARVILLSRSPEKLEVAAQRLRNEAGYDAEIETHPLDLTSAPAVQALWADLRARRQRVDVLVLNAAYLRTSNLGPGPGNFESHLLMFDLGLTANVRMTHKFLEQDYGKPVGKKTIINVSSMAALCSPARLASASPASLRGMGNYGAVKIALAKWMEHLAEETDSKDTQIVSIHPGTVYTPGAASTSGSFKLDKNAAFWNDEQLPGDFIVWASTPAAYFLHGKFAFCNWDVPQLLERAAEITSTHGMLNVGIYGLKPVDASLFFGSQ